MKENFNQPHPQMNKGRKPRDNKTKLKIALA